MQDQLLKTIGSRIESLRIECNVSRAKLEEACDLPSQSIKRIERNPSMTFDVSALCAIADYFDVDVDYILGRQNVKRRVIADASKVTGLSYDAIKEISSWGMLHSINKTTLSALICSPSFGTFINYIKMYCEISDEEAFSHIDDLPISDKEIILAAIQNSMALMINEAKKAVHDELVIEEKQLYNKLHEALIEKETKGGE